MTDTRRLASISNLATRILSSVHVTLGIRYSPNGPVLPFGMQRDNPDRASAFVQAILREWGEQEPKGIQLGVM